MYESYVWPNANQFKRDRKLIIEWFRELLQSVAKKIDEKERSIS